MALRGYPVLFELVVTHGYFAETDRCRLRFAPDAATAAWLASAGVLLRATNNGLKGYWPAGAAGGAPRLDEAIALGFEVRPVDPAFVLYTAGLDPPPAALAPTPAVSVTTTPSVALPVFDSAAAQRDAGDGALVMSDPSTPATGRPMGGGFHMVIRLQPGPQPVGQVYRVALNSRAVVWKYLLTGDWSGVAPSLRDAGQNGSPRRGVGLSFDRDADDAQLADGRTALAFRSSQAIALSDRPEQRFELWTAERGASDRLLVKSLPAADPRGLALEDPADPSSLVCEIFVAR